MKEDLSEYSKKDQELIRNTNEEWENRPGDYRLSCWFSLSYASWLTLPRALMEDMPEDWQKRMAICLEEFSDTYKGDWIEGGQLYVSMKKNGKFTQIPEHLCNYRRPNKEKIRELTDDRW